VAGARLALACEGGGGEEGRGGEEEVEELHVEKWTWKGVEGLGCGGGGDWVDGGCSAVLVKSEREDVDLSWRTGSFYTRSSCPILKVQVR
jgi:hypothetical protein